MDYCDEIESIIKYAKDNQSFSWFKPWDAPAEPRPLTRQMLVDYFWEQDKQFAHLRTAGQQSRIDQLFADMSERLGVPEV